MKRPITKLCELPTKEAVIGTTTQNNKSMAEQATEHRYNLRSQKTKANMSTITLFTLLITALFAQILGNESSTPFTITPFHNQPGIYFEELGNANLIHNEWNIIVYYNLENYWRELDGYQNCLKKIEELCNTLTYERTSCQTVIKQFHIHLTQIQMKNDSLYEKLFGLLDENRIKITSWNSSEIILQF